MAIWRHDGLAHMRALTAGSVHLVLLPGIVLRNLCVKGAAASTVSAVSQERGSLQPRSLSLHPLQAVVTAEMFPGILMLSKRLRLCGWRASNSLPWNDGVLRALRSQIGCRFCGELVAGACAWAAKAEHCSHSLQQSCSCSAAAIPIIVAQQGYADSCFK